MEHCTRKPGNEKAIGEFGRDRMEQAMRLRIRDTIEELVKEELDAALGAPKSRAWASSVKATVMARGSGR